MSTHSAPTIGPDDHTQIPARAGTVPPDDSTSSSSTTVPPLTTSPGALSAQGRKIVVLLDGTANKYGKKNSNVLKLLSVVEADEDTQLVYYSSGFGTILPDGTSAWGKIKQRVAKAADMGFAWSFENLVCDAYRFLMDHSRKHDKIYIFGFSRGAYAARALAGMLERIGLLNTGNHNQIPLAYEAYTKSMSVNHPDNGEEDPTLLYRRIFARSRPVAVEFLGVWDTVSSLGIFAGRPHPLRFPFASQSQSTKFFRQALALDERGGRFTPEYWREGPEMSLSKEQYIDVVKDYVMTANWHEVDFKKRLKDVEKELEGWAAELEETENGVMREKMVECWFMGCHSDVGGGNDLNGADTLSNIPFRWMLREAVRCGLRLGPRGVSLQPVLNIDPPTDPNLVSTLDRLEKLNHYIRLKERSTRSTEPDRAIREILATMTQEDLAQLVEIAAKGDTRVTDAGDIGRDMKCPIKESLTWPWRLISLVPMKPPVWTTKAVTAAWRDNLGRGRQIYPSQKIHKSVQLRLVHDDLLPDNVDRYLRPRANMPMYRPGWEELREGSGSEAITWEE